MYPKKFEDLINCYSKLPGVGKKTAERYAFTTINWDEETFHNFLNALNEINKGIHFCNICGNMSEDEMCDICKDVSRNKKIICVVESCKNIATIESMNEYNGVYHVLNGTINTNKGIMPENLNIEKLLNRIDSSIDEVILALDPTIEGETTSLYLTKLLDNKVKVTKLAQGISLGSHLDYADQLTLLKSFQNRK